MQRGGARPGVGRPKKPLADKIIEGNPGKRELTKLKFPAGEKSNTGFEKKSNSQKSKTKNSRRMPSFLDMAAKEGGDVLPSASGIYKMLAEWVDGSGCGELVAPNLIEDFAFLRRAYLECEYMNRRLGRIASGKRSPYVNMALDYQKAMMAVYNQIWLIVSQNCETKYEGKNEFLEMLRNRGF